MPASKQISRSVLYTATLVTAALFLVSGLCALLLFLLFPSILSSLSAPGLLSYLFLSLFGSTALGLFAAAMVGVGVAVGGLWRTSIAAEIAAGVVVVTYLIDLLAPPLKWPEWVHRLALTANLGQPMIGDWNPVGVIACVVIAAGGVLLGAWGFARRDVSD